MTTLPDRPEHRPARHRRPERRGRRAPTTATAWSANINPLVDKARAEEVPVVWVQHSDDDLPQRQRGVAVRARARPATAEPVVHKQLRRLVRGHRPRGAARRAAASGRLVVTGAQTDACIRSTLHGAFVRGYDVTLVGDAHTTEDLTAYGAPTPDLVIAHTNLYWQWSERAGTHGDVVHGRRGRASPRPAGLRRASDRADGRGSGRPTLTWQRNPKASRVIRSEIRRHESALDCALTAPRSL